MSTSLLLDTATWDLTVDLSGSIAICDEPYATAQSIACALRLFSGELWYDDSQGIPYRTRILGQPPSINYLKALFVQVALTVPTVASAVAFITEFNERKLVGQVQAKLKSGETVTVGAGADQLGLWYVTAISP